VDAGARFDLRITAIGASPSTLTDVPALLDPADISTAFNTSISHTWGGVQTIAAEVVTDAAFTIAKLADGAVGAPSLRFSSSPSTGWWWDAANSRPVLSLAGAEAISISPSGGLVNAHPAGYIGSDHRLAVTDINTQTAGHILAHFQLHTNAGQDNGVSRFYGRMTGQDGGGPGQLRAAEMQIIRDTVAGASTSHILEANVIDCVVDATDPRRVVVFQGSAEGKFSFPSAVAGQGVGLHLYGDIGFESFWRFYGPNYYTDGTNPILPAADPTADLVSKMSSAGTLYTTGNFVLSKNSRSVSGTYPSISITGNWVDLWGIIPASDDFYIQDLVAATNRFSIGHGSTGNTWLVAGASGKVGINTNAPSNTVHISGGSNGVRIDGPLGFATSPISKQTITGSKGGNAALTNLMIGLAALGLFTDSTT
jgi:hypothetical protein